MPTNLAVLSRAKSALVVCVAVIGLALLALVGQADGSASQRALESGEPRLAGGSTVQTGSEVFDWPTATLDVTWKLALVVGIIYVVLALVKRYAMGGVLGTKRGALQILEATTLAPNRGLYLVRAGDRQLLLGVTPTQITALSEWYPELLGSEAPSTDALVASFVAQTRP